MSGQTIDISALYASEQNRLKRLIDRLIGNKASSDDLVHQAFLNLVSAARDGTIDNYPGYLTTTARNLSLNYMRDMRRRGEVTLSDHDMAALPDSTPSPETAAIYRCELRRVLTAVASLSPRRREAFVLNKFEGMTYDEIAMRQKVSRNTVISHIVSALAALDQQLGYK